MKVGELLDALEADYRLRGVRSLPQVLAHMKPIREHFGHAKAASVTAEAADRYIERRLADKRQPATINRETQILGQALRLAVERRLLSAAPSLRKLAERNVRQGFLDRADFEAMVANLPADLQDVARFGYLSAWRRGEIVSLLWSDVDLPGRVIRLRPEESKNGQARLLPLSDDLHKIIRRREAARVVTCEGQPTVVASLVFHRAGRPIVDFRKAWATACIEAGFSKPKTGKDGRPVLDGKGQPVAAASALFHDLRRSGVRTLIRAGVDPSVAMKISGHKTRAMLDRYNIVDETDIRAAVTKAETYLHAQPTERKVVALRAVQG